MPNGLKRIKIKLFNLRKSLRGDYKRSYSQCGEDLMIDAIFTSLKIDKPSYIDIGAFQPRKLNNTYLLYRKGSRGINVEPNPLAMAAFKKERPDDINLNIGISDTPGTLDYYVMNASTLNTFSKHDAEENQAKYGYRIEEVKKIETKGLSDILATHNGGSFPDLLSIDTEGLDLRILKSIDWKKSSPKVICCETMSYHEGGKGAKIPEMSDFLHGVGYMTYGDTYINTIFVLKSLWERH